MERNSNANKKTKASGVIKREFAELVGQYKLSEETLEAIDRALGITQNDVLLCDIACLDYVEHVIALETTPKELWVIPPSSSKSVPQDIAWDEIENEASARYEKLTKSSEGKLGCFKGFTNAAPNRTFKQVRTACETGIPIESPLDRLGWDPVWSDIGSGDALCGVAVFERAEELKGPGTLTEGNVVLKGLTWAFELPDNYVVLAFDGSSDICHMEDLSNPEDPWVRDITPLDIAVNDGCLLPSMYRNGVELMDQTTLGEIATSVSRGTSLNSKDLDIVGKAKFGSVVGTAFAPIKVDYRADKDDLFYVDSSCFDKGKIWPQRLKAIPKGQERYTVHSHDGEVLLVSRNGKQFAFYKPLCPTLIANSVFVVKLDSVASKEYLECWFRSWFTRSWLYDNGRTLSKGVLSSLPIPIVNDEIASLIVKREQSIDEELVALRDKIGMLEWINRFAPLAAVMGSAANEPKESCR